MRRIANPVRQAGRAANRRRSFSLVELMVVVAIIALLAGLLAASMRPALEYARSARCRSNLRQIGMAMGKYRSDCDGYFMEGSGAGADKVKKFGTRAMPPPGAGPFPPGIVRAPPYSEDPYGGSANEQADLSAFKDGLMGGVGGGGNFSPDGIYGPDFIANYVLARNDRSVLHCPKVNLEIFDTNSLLFKGFATTIDDIEIEGHKTYHEDNAGKANSYGLNANVGGVLDGYAVVYVDWNAPYGWGASVNVKVTNIWVMDPNTVGVDVRTNYGAEGSLKGAPGYQTEIGFHHFGAANYVARDGHVGTIPSNALREEFFKLFTGTNN